MSTESATEPALISTAELSKRLGVSKSTILAWATHDAQFRTCIIRKTYNTTYWSVARLRDEGYLTSPIAIVEQLPAISFQWSSPLIGGLS